MIESNRQKLSSPTGGTTNIRCSNVHQQPSSTNFKNTTTTRTSSRQLLHPLSYKSNHFSQSFDSSGIGADMPKDNNNYRKLSMKNDFIHHNQQKSMNEIDRKHGQYITAARPATSQATYYKRQEHHDDKNNRRTSDSYSHQQQQQHHKSFDFYGRQWKSDDATSPSQMHTIDEDHQLDAMSLKPEHHHSSTPLSTNLLSITPRVSIDICCSPTDTTNSEQSLNLTLQLFTVRQKRALRSTFVQLNAGGNLIRLMSLILHRVSLKCPEMRALFLTTGFVNTLNRRHCAQSQSSSTIITEHDHCIMMARLLDEIVERIDAFDEVRMTIYIILVMNNYY
jgi:hypothetical protein